LLGVNALVNGDQWLKCWYLLTDEFSEPARTDTTIFWFGSVRFCSRLYSTAVM